ncbi:hypothetical protein [Arthrobacter sp. QXT-31]|uniref:hypothetical protein n=1 Tax=Arthrobacter sp. QXT-31 TaxID=1357915 RepID=UPI00097182FA|nr:hypothetical protein [Arthrobacter sp. QXT-31]APX00507.1 hypothetical protein BWQ92_01130 [Arthrobacter sp. QXT-31]
MEQIFYGLAVLACPLGMGAMMWLMMRSGKKASADAAPTEASAAELAQLRADLDRLRAGQNLAHESGTAADKGTR